MKEDEKCYKSQKGFDRVEEFIKVDWWLNLIDDESWLTINWNTVTDRQTNKWTDGQW